MASLNVDENAQNARYNCVMQYAPKKVKSQNSAHASPETLR